MLKLRSLCHGRLIRTYSTAAAPTRLLEGRSAIITGASRGIGLAITRLFAQNGARCLLISQNADRLKAAAESIRESSGSNPDDFAWLSCDLAEDEPWARFFASHRRGSVKAEESVGGTLPQEAVHWIAASPHPHILVNAAGITHRSLLTRTNAASQRLVTRTNLDATITACREVGKQMLRRKDVKQTSGCVINIASLLATHGGRGSSVYAASKAGILGLTRALASEMGPLGVRVNAISPGWVETDMTSGMSEPAKAELVKQIPLGRFGRAGEVAEAALFLATNKYANNCVLNLDGGLAAEL